MDKLLKGIEEYNAYEEIASTLFTVIKFPVSDHRNVCTSYPEVEDCLTEYFVRKDLYSLLHDEQIMNIRLCCSRLVDFSKVMPNKALRFNPDTEPYTLLFDILETYQRHVMSDVDRGNRFSLVRTMNTQTGWKTWQSIRTDVRIHYWKNIDTYVKVLQDVTRAVSGFGFNANYSVSDWLMDNGFKAIDLVYSVNSTFKDSKLTNSDVAEIGVVQTDDPVKEVQRIQNALFLFVYDPEVFPKFYYGCEKCIPPNATQFWQIYLTTNPKRYAFTNVTYKELPSRKD